jgi:UDP-N-acetylglucosamine transferase subunit ALG13
MIFVTVGQMLGFDRFIRAMDKWAELNPQEEVRAQIGDGKYQPQSMQWVRMMSSTEFNATVARAELLVAHVGMGTFFVSMGTGKPVVMMPRRASLMEHTTDHQVHTLRWLGKKPGVFAADNEDDLPAAISRARAMAAKLDGFQRFAPGPFIAKLREAILS